MGKPEQCVAIVGHIPPPFGGVSVHVARLVDRLRKTELPIRLYEMGGRSNAALQIVPAAMRPWWFLKFLCFCPESVVHIHAYRSSVMMVAAFLLFFRRRTLILTLHGAATLRWYSRVGFVRRFLWRAAVSRVDSILCVNQELKDWLSNLGVPEQRITVAPAYISPSAAETDPSNIPPEAHEFLRNHDTVIATHGWFGHFVDGIHIYSFDLLAQLLEHLRGSSPAVGMFTVISGTKDAAHREQIFRLRRERGLENHWLILEQPFWAAALFARSDLFVRPTITDGDSVSIRECLSLGIPVVASDCVSRPEGCLLFRNRDLSSLLSTVSRVLSQRSISCDTASASRQGDTATIIESIYRRILGERGIPNTFGLDKKREREAVL